jgi:cell division protein FtsQ
VLVAIGFAVYLSPAFTVKEVTVEGASRLTNERLTELAAVPADSTLLRLDVEGIQSRVASDPWVEQVEIQRSFPATVVLLVTERQIAAVVELPSAGTSATVDNWLIASDGVWLGSYKEPASLATGEEPAEGEEGSDEAAVEEDPADTEQVDGEDVAGSENPDNQNATPPEDTTSLLEGVLVTISEVKQYVHVKDASRTITPVVGQTTTDEGVLNALALIKGFSPEMLALVQSVSAPDTINTTLTLTNYVGVAFGVAEDIEAKEKVILKLLSEHEGLITYINVRVADRATYRAAG